jgi:serine protease Do
MATPRGINAEDGAIALQYLTGPSCGRATWLIGADLEFSLKEGRFPHVTSARPGEDCAGAIAHLRTSRGTYEITALADRALWVNGERVKSRILQDQDLIEFGDTGPLSRFCIYRQERSARKSVAEIVRDGLVYLRVSRRPFGQRIKRFLVSLGGRLARETTLLFRIGVIMAIVILAVTVFQQGRINTLLREQISSETEKIDAFSAALARARDEALTPADLNSLRGEFGEKFTSAAERLQALEQRSQAAATVIAKSSFSVVFLQGAYGFRETTSGRMLRHIIGADGSRLLSANGQPLLSLDGEGPVAERQFSGTGFAIGDGTRLITNRHVARPWENDANVEALAGRNLEPVMLKYIAYAPGIKEAGTVELLRVSSVSDLAILRLDGMAEIIPGLELAEALPRAGEEVIVMGYPTGLRSMLIHAGQEIVAELQESAGTDFWLVAALLAERGHIVPLASRGIVGKSTPSSVVYDAETTHGGSGGPVIDTSGAVVAVNAAVLPEFGGANLGVPAHEVRALLELDGES